MRTIPHHTGGTFLPITNDNDLPSTTVNIDNNLHPITAVNVIDFNAILNELIKMKQEFDKLKEEHGKLKEEINNLKKYSNILNSMVVFPFVSFFFCCCNFFSRKKKIIFSHFVLFSSKCNGKITIVWSIKI